VEKGKDCRLMLGKKHRIPNLLLLLLLVLPLRTLADATVWFLYDESNTYQQQFVEDSEVLLRRALPEVILRRANLTESESTLQLAPAEDVTLLITVGDAAAKMATIYRLTTINTLITRHSYDLYQGDAQAHRSAIYLDQPVERHLQLVKNALPSHEKLTVLLGPESQQLATELKQQSQRLALLLQIIKVDEESVIGKLFGQKLFAEDTLLLLPDAEVVNRRTVKPLVLGSYSQGIPLVGYSQALVKAGALLAVHSSLPVLEQELLTMVKGYLSGGVLPPPRFAADFEISANYQLARALKISLPSESILKKGLQEQLR